MTFDVSDLNDDERQVVRRVAENALARIRLGRVKYGPLEIDNDERNWGREAREEMTDGDIYLVIDEIAAERKR